MHPYWGGAFFTDLRGFLGAGVFLGGDWSGGVLVRDFFVYDVVLRCRRCSGVSEVEGE